MLLLSFFFSFAEYCNKTVFNHHKHSIFFRYIYTATCFDNKVVIFRQFKYIKIKFNWKFTFVWLVGDLNASFLQYMPLRNFEKKNE